MTRHAFLSDNEAGTDPRILAALLAANEGLALPYGADDLSARAKALCSEVFEREVFVFPTPTGTAANGLSLAALTPPYGAILCHEAAHILTSEAGAAEFFTSGARLIALPGAQGRFSAETLRAALETIAADGVRQPKPAAISLTQASESGTVYTLAETRDITGIAHGAGLGVHMDGARFANALVHLGCSPAEATWKAGVDILSFGLTKNGGMNTDAIIVFDAGIAADLNHRYKRAGLAQSKMRFASAQILASLTGGLWLDNARRANANAQRLAGALAGCAGATLAQPVEANEIFVHLPGPVLTALAEAGLFLRPWPGSQPGLFRLVTSFADDEALIARVLAAVAPYSSQPVTTPLTS